MAIVIINPFVGCTREIMNERRMAIIIEKIFETVSLTERMVLEFKSAATILACVISFAPFNSSLLNGVRTKSPTFEIY